MQYYMYLLKIQNRAFTSFGGKGNVAADKNPLRIIKSCLPYCVEKSVLSHRRVMGGGGGGGAVKHPGIRSGLVF